MNEIIEVYNSTNVRSINLNEKTLFTILVSLNFIIFISLILFVSTIASERGGILEFFSNPIIGRQLITKADSIQQWNPILSFAGYGVSLITISCILGGILFCYNSKIYKLVSISPLLLGMLISIVKFSRYTLLVLILYWIFSALLFTFYLGDLDKKKIIRKLIWGSLLIIISVFLIFYLIISLRFFIDPKNITQTFLLQGHYYIVGNIIALDSYLNNDIYLHWGAGLFRTILKWLARIGLYEKENVLDIRHPFVKISSTVVSNTYTYVRALYEDYGIIGLLLLSFLWGNISAKLINTYLNNFSLLNLYFAIIVIVGFCLSFFSFFYLVISKIIYEISILYLVQNYIFKKSGLNTS